MEDPHLHTKHVPNTSRHQDIVRVDCQGVDESLVAREVLQEIAIRKFPDFDVVR